MPYDLTDAYVDNLDLRNQLQALIQLLIDKGIIDKPKEDKDEKKQESKK